MRSQACLYSNRAWGRLARRETTRSRASFSRSTISPRASRPIEWNVFLPGRSHGNGLEVGSVWHWRGAPCYPCSGMPQHKRVRLGREHGRSIPFSDHQNRRKDVLASVAIRASAAWCTVAPPGHDLGNLRGYTPTGRGCQPIQWDGGGGVATTAGLPEQDSTAWGEHDGDDASGTRHGPGHRPER